MSEAGLSGLVGRRCGKDDRLVIKRMLGEGGFGAVFEAFDTVREERYAIKFLLQSWTNDSELVRRFRHEGVRWKELRHPNLLRILGLGRQFGMPFILSEYVEGRDLERVTKEESPLPHREALRIARDIALGLAEVHRHDVVHRDLKPTNVMLRQDDRTVKVLDFGIAKYLNTDSMLTRPGDVIGTPGFISPEQLKGGDIDGRSDVFSLGAVLYDLVTGTKAFRGASEKEVLKRTATGDYVPLQKVRQDSPRGMVRLVDRMLHRSPRRRIQSMEEVVARIQRVEAGLS